MPDFDGIELARRLHKQGRSEKIVFFSGYKDFEYARLAMEYGVKYYLLKPVIYSDISSKLKQIKQELDAITVSSSDGPTPDISLSSVKLRKIRDCVQSNYRDVTLASLADSLKMNSCYLSRFFHEKTGEKLSEYITLTRMNRARDLLRSGECRTLRELGDRVGYCNSISFAKAFRKAYGLSPSAFRKDFDAPRENHNEPQY